MSGHSKWHRIKHKKAATDSKRGQQFTRLASQISSAARANPDPNKNPALREAITQAKQANMPQDNIDRLLKKGSDNPAQTITYEAFGPSGTALIIITVTDNTKRTVAELRTLLKNHGGSLGQPGSVMWKFKATPDNNYQAQYPAQVDDSVKDQINRLTKILLDHPDVTTVFTDSN